MVRRAARLAAGGALMMLAAAGTVEAQEGGMMKALTRDYNASGLALYRALARAPGNLVLSPYSIGSGLAMVRSGARGERLTRRIGSSSERSSIACAFGATLNAVKSKSSGYRSRDPRTRSPDPR